MALQRWAMSATALQRECFLWSDMHFLQSTCTGTLQLLKMTLRVTHLLQRTDFWTLNPENVFKWFTLNLPSKNILQDDRSTPMTPSRFLLIPTNHLQTNTLIIMHCLYLRSSNKLPPSRHFQTAERIANVDVRILPPIPAHLRYQHISDTSTPSPLLPQSQKWHLSLTQYTGLMASLLAAWRRNDSMSVAFTILIKN